MLFVIQTTAKQKSLCSFCHCDIFAHIQTLGNVNRHWVYSRRYGYFLDEDWIIQNYFWQSLLTALFGVFILALMHRPVNIGYDKILKKEIWGVWYQENNSTEYFAKRDQKLSQQGKDSE